MKAIRDRSLNDTPTFEGDLGMYFEHLWRDVDGRERREANSEPPHPMVRLACTGELADVGQIGLVVVRTSPVGTELVEFLCPRCERLHESLPFR